MSSNKHVRPPRVKMSKVYLIPVVLFLLCILTYFGTSLATILEGHTNIPYISEGGTYVPQSCVFSQTINLVCFLNGIIIYTRFNQVKLLMFHHSELIKSARLNNITMWVGFGSCFGLNIVANYQLTNVPSVHYIGALLCFFLGTLYFWLQSYISIRVQAYTGSIRLAYIRFILAAFCSFFFFVTIFTSCAFIQLILQEEHASCKYLTVSVISEWVVALIFCFYLLSFAHEFRQIGMDPPKFSIIGYENRNLNV